MRALLILFQTAAWTADWPQFRGVDGHGVASGSRVPVHFSPASNVQWRTELPPGKSSPVIFGKRLCLTGSDAIKLTTLCLDTESGRVLWSQSVEARRKENRHVLNHPASPTPVGDGKNLYVFFSDFGLISYTLDGAERWRLPMEPFSNLHGMAASPILVGGKIILALDQDTSAHLLAIGKDSGRVLWKADRSDFTHSFSVPAVYRPVKGPAEIVMPGAYQMTGYSAETGEKLWWLRGLTWQPKSAPVVADGIAYFNGWAPGGDQGQQRDLPPFEQVIRTADLDGDGKLSQSEVPPDLRHSGSWGAIDLDHDDKLSARDWSFYRARRAARNALLAVRLGGRGDVTASHVLWRFDKSLPDVPCPLLYRDVLYLVRTGGIFTTVNPKTGEAFKQGRLNGALEGYYASPVAADGKIYAASEHGKVVVLKAEAEWEVLAVNDFGEDIYATPAIVGDRMYLRTGSAVYCIREKIGSRGSTPSAGPVQ